MINIGCTWQNMVNKNKKQMMNMNLSLIIIYHLSIIECLKIDYNR